MGRRRPADRGAMDFCCVSALSNREREESREASPTWPPAARWLSGRPSSSPLSPSSTLPLLPLHSLFRPPSDLKRRAEEAVAWLKRWTEEAVATRLTVEPAMDAMKLAGLCDALRLYLRPAVRSLPERPPWHRRVVRGLALRGLASTTCCSSSSPPRVHDIYHVYCEFVYKTELTPRGRLAKSTSEPKRGRMSKTATDISMMWASRMIHSLAVVAVVVPRVEITLAFPLCPT